MGGSFNGQFSCAPSPPSLREVAAKLTEGVSYPKNYTLFVTAFRK